MSNLFPNTVANDNRKKSATIKNKILSASLKNSEQTDFKSKHKSKFKKLKFDTVLLVDLLKKSKISATTNILFKKSKKNFPIKKNNSIFKYKNIPGIEKLHHLTNADIDDLITDKSERSIIEFSNFRYKNNSERKIFNPKNKNINDSYIITDSSNNKNNKKLYVTNINMNKNINKNTYNGINKSCTWKSRKFTRNIILSHSNDINYTFNKNCKLYDKKNIKPTIKSFLINKKYLDINSNSLLNLENNKLKMFLPQNNNTKPNIENNGVTKSEEKKNKINFDNSFYSVFKNIKKFKRSSQIDRLIFKIENPEECFEEFVDKEKPGDKYQAFKNQIFRHRNKVDKMILEIKLNHNKCEEAVKKNSLETLKRKYIVKTLYNM